jgi:hypothetical protein
LIVLHNSPRPPVAPRRAPQPPKLFFFFFFFFFFFSTRLLVTCLGAELTSLFASCPPRPRSPTSPAYR